MRILPIALVEREADDAVLVDHAERASRVTHGHPRAQVACALYTLVVTRLLAGERDRTAALADARARLERSGRRPTRPPRGARAPPRILRTERAWASSGTASGRPGMRSRVPSRTARRSSEPSRTATTPTRPRPSPADSRGPTGASMDPVRLARGDARTRGRRAARRRCARREPMSRSASTTSTCVRYRGWRSPGRLGMTFAPGKRNVLPA